MFRTPASFLALVGLLAACSSPPIPHARPLAPAPDVPGEAGPARPDPAERIEALAEALERSRVEHDIPGMAVAVVYRGRVLMARGFGVRDLERGDAVTPETLFSIGSATKAFTATLVAMLVEEGVVAWDDPIAKHLPALRLRVRSSEAGAEATLRDGLSHRTGFPRMSILFASGSLDRDEIFSHAARAEPTEELRAKFLYNNVVFAAAGEAAARAAGSTWEELVRARILEPLGMKGTLVSAATAAADPRLATGYTFHSDRKVHVREQVRVVDAIAPAGSIHSSAAEMAAWLRLQVGRGEIDGRRLISEARLAETHEVQTDAGHAGYALGWMVGQWRGRTFIEHGGNIDGYAASVGFLPGDRLGYVLLTNVTSTPLQVGIGSLVFDTLLLTEEDAAAPSEDLAPYLGKYVADFGPFQDARFEVLERGGQLAVDVPGQTVFELRPPDANGRRELALSDQIAFSFVRGPDGDVLALVLHQAGFDFEMPREGVELPVEVDGDAAAPYLGAYADADGKLTVRVVIRNGRLAADVPGQLVYELHAPDGEGRWRFRARRDHFVRFERDGDSPAARLVLDQGAEVVLARVKGKGVPGPATADELHRLRGAGARKKALAGIGVGAMEGTVKVPQAGVEGRFTATFAGTDRYRLEIDFGKIGDQVLVVSGERAWSAGSFATPEQLEGLRLLQARVGHPAALLGDWRDVFDSVRVVAREEGAGAGVHVVDLRAGELPPVRVRVDARTGDVVASATTQIEAIGRFPIETSFSDFRVVHGLRIPHRMVVENPHSGQMVMEVERVRRRVPEDPKRFSPDLPPAP